MLIQMSFYEFSSEDFSKVIQDTRFLQGVQIAVEESFFPSKSHFRGDPQLLLELEKSPRELLWDKVKHLPLPYISQCEDPSYYEKEYGPDDPSTKNVARDLETRQLLLDQAKSKLDPAWWCYIHNCEAQALFITYTMCRLLYPEKKFYLYNGRYHRVILNFPLEAYSKLSLDRKLSRDLTQPLVFDPISQLLPDENLEWIFAGEDAFDHKRVVLPEEMMNWYIKNFGYAEIQPEPFHKWFQGLP